MHLKEEHKNSAELRLHNIPFYSSAAVICFDDLQWFDMMCPNYPDEMTAYGSRKNWSQQLLTWSATKGRARLSLWAAWWWLRVCRFLRRTSGSNRVSEWMWEIQPWTLRTWQQPGGAVRHALGWFMAKGAIRRLTSKFCHPPATCSPGQGWWAAHRAFAIDHQS